MIVAAYIAAIITMILSAVAFYGFSVAYSTTDDPQYRLAAINAGMVMAGCLGFIIALSIIARSGHGF